MTILPRHTPRTARSYDYAWARRGRRAFRLLVAAAVLFAFALWFSEGYLRYDQNETQYRMALTLHPAQARPILRHVVKRETEENETPPSRYVEALALVEETAEDALAAYEQAYKINPRNAFLIVNYGCFLYLGGQYEEARERFREAGVNPPRNALPRYLEAAALAASMEPDDDPSDLIALLTRANAAGDPVLYPEPPWHESLPKQGRRHMELRGNAAERIAKPLADCGRLIVSRASADIDRGEFRDWNNWLEKMHTMGVRLMGGGPQDSLPTIPQLTVALELQYAAANLLGRISEAAGGVVEPRVNDTLLRTEQTLKTLEEFDDQTELLLEGHRERLLQPIFLLLQTALLFMMMYAVAWCLHGLGSGGTSARAAPHLLIGKLAPAVGLFCMLGILLLFMSRQGAVDTAYEWHLGVLWRFVSLALTALGLIYPLMMVRMGRIAQGAGADQKVTPRRYVGVYGCLLRRYMGILCGGLALLICTWLIVYRVVFSAYPFQMELISTGLELETADLVQEIRRYLETGAL